MFEVAIAAPCISRRFTKKCLDGSFRPVNDRPRNPRLSYSNRHRTKNAADMAKPYDRRRAGDCRPDLRLRTLSRHYEKT
jgi:hypothetical protein